MFLLSQAQLWQEQGIDKHQCQEDGACPVKDRCTVLATCVSDMQLTEEVHLTGELKPIHKASEDNGTDNYGTEIMQHGACAQELTQNQYGGKVACRTCHKQH